jgi:high affinity Mn2+ porin
LRVGYFLTGNEPNSNQFDMKLFTRGAYVTELETRYTAFSRPGKFRVAVWADTYFSGSYREAIDLTLISAGLDPNDAILLTRQARTKYGYYLNFEQALIDASLSFGTSIRGTSWGRPDDKIGLAGAINAISRDHRDFLAIGGLGILIGDGQINYRPEKILETFYAYNVNKWSTLTFDYQFIADVAHNADRGPVSVFSARLHAEF